MEAGLQAQVNRTVVLRRGRCSHERSTDARWVTPPTRPMGALRLHMALVWRCGLVEDSEDLCRRERHEG